MCHRGLRRLGAFDIRAPVSDRARAQQGQNWNPDWYVRLDVRWLAWAVLPDRLAKRAWLNWYATQFPAAEVNFSFYRTPSLEAVTAWRKATPPDFVFAWKASKFITHWKRLDPDTCQNSIDLMVTRLKALKEKAGPVLFQLPPQFEANCDRLAKFLRMLPPRYRYAFEFRHPSWYEPRILDVLRKHDVALCLSDHHHAPAPWIVTAGHVYVRGHGPGGRYKDNYAEGDLARVGRSHPQMAAAR